MEVDQVDMNSTPVGNSPEHAESPTSDDESDLIDSNSLIAMPDHIIDKIFDSLNDLPDRKSLSESCTRFNGIFSHPLHINKVWLDLKKSPHVVKSLISSSRVYQNLIWNRNLPIKVLQHLSLNLKCLKIQIRPDNSDDLEESFAKLLPFCANLTHLVVDPTGYEERKNNLNLFDPDVDFDRITMKNLKFLRMDMKFYKYLSDHFIDFSSTVKLRYIDLYADDDLEYEEFEIEDLNSDIRALLTAQKHLKNLSLEVDKKFFDQKLVLQCKLKKLELNASLNFDNLEQAGKFLDFMESQDELKSFEHANILFPECNERVKHFKQKRMNMKIEELQISFWNEHSSRYLDSADKTMLMGPPNLAVKKIYMYFNGGVSGDIKSYFPLIDSKYPNVTCIAPQSSLKVDCVALKGFKKLTILHLDELESLKLITIPNLKYFELSLEMSMADEQIIEFFMRHKTIETLEFTFDCHSIDNESDREKSTKLIKVIDSALQNLKDLKSINLNEIGVMKQENPLINKIIFSIAKYAQPGFHFKSLKGLEVLKRDDMRIVRKYEGRWVRMINCKKTNLQ